MTSVLPPSTRVRGRSAAEVSHDLATRRPLVLLAPLGGVVAAAGVLLVCLAVGVVGWFLTDAGSHGTPRDGLRAGALGWLMAHGSGVTVQGAAVTIVPLGVTAVCAWAIWRIGHRVGESVSGHGPDAVRIADGERDLTVPLATGLFALGYVATAVVTARLAATPATGTDTGSDTGRVVLWSLLLTACVGGSAIAVGSGRAAIWASFVPPWVRAALLGCRRILLTWVAVAFATFAVALLLDVSTAVNVMSQLQTDAGDATLFTLLSATLLPNATVFAGSYLLGPGFSVGVGTLVSPGAVVIGPLPMFPLLAALPESGPPAGWTTLLVAAPVLVAALGAAWAQRRLPTVRWEEGAVRGLAGGVLAGLLFGILASLAGGAAGPGRMRDVGPLSFDVLVYGVAAFGIGALLGGLAMTWWQRRGAETDEDREPAGA